jgi:O-antigen/teichoic acid export membrane protein
MKKDVKSDFIKYIPSKILPGLFFLVFTPIITRLFNPSQYGQYSIVISTVSVLLIMSSDWIVNSVMRFYPEYQRKNQLELFRGTVQRISLVSVIIISVVYCLGILLLQKPLGPQLFHYLAIGLGIFIVGSFFNVAQSILQIKRKVFSYSLFSVWRQCGCYLCGILVVIIFKKGMNSYLLGIFGGILISLPYLYWLSFGKINSTQYSSFLQKDMFNYGFPLVATNIASWLLTYADRYILQIYRGSGEVGLYSISHSLADQSIQLVVALMVLSSAPVVMKTWEEKGPEETRKLLSDITRYYLIIVMPVFVGISLLSKQVVGLLASKSFFEGHAIMPYVAGSILLYGFQRNYQLGLLFYKKTKIIMILIILSAILNVGANLIFVPRFGFVAAGFNKMAAYVLYTILIIVVSRHYFQWKFPFAALFKVTAACLVLMVIVVLIKYLVAGNVMVICLSVAMGGSAYFILLYFMKEIDIKTVFKTMN